MRRSPFASRGTWLGLCLALTLTLASSATAASFTATPGSATANPGAEVVVPLTVKGAPALAALDLDLVYDPAVLEFAKVENGPLLDNGMLESNAPQPGRLKVSLVSQNGINGDGVIFSAHFKVKGDSGSKSPLTLQNVRASAVPKGHEAMAGMNHLIDALAKVEPGEITVAGGLPIYGIAAGAVALFIVVLMIIRKRRGTPAR